MAMTPKRGKRSHGDESAPAGLVFVLRFYNGGSPNSLQANTNMRNICDQQLNYRCQLEVVDICQQPERAPLDGDPANEG
jgi:hypothetical protein